ncbi:hypothetical protein [Glycomyces sp. NPDC021274]|uniref:hypothetical protein n=1 Tax=Glycomyces sp. NPDC021274 TaxID=3155120 RepID=UPI0033DF7857
MRATTAAATAAIAGGTFAIIYGTIEVTAAAAGLTISDGVRTLAANFIGIVVLGPLGLAILCRQRTILDELGCLKDLVLTDDRFQAQREYNAIRRQLGDDGDNITRLYPKE